MPFAGYEDFDECVQENQDKDNPEAYCAWLHEQETGELPQRSDKIVDLINIDVFAEFFTKGGSGSGNWGHQGLPGQMGGSSETGGTSEEFKNIPKEVRYSFDPYTAEFSNERHLKHVEKLDGQEYADYMEELDEYIDAEELGEDTMRTLDYTKEELKQMREKVDGVAREAASGKYKPGAKIDNKKVSSEVYSRLDDNYKNAARSEMYERRQFDTQTALNDYIRDNVPTEEYGDVFGRIDSAETLEELDEIAEEFGADDSYKEPLDEMIEEEMAQKLDLWNETSGDHQPEAVAMQMAVKEEFGLDNSNVEFLSDSVLSKAEGEYDRNKGIYTALARGQYDYTQEMLEEAGVDEMVLYRGMRFPSYDVPDELSNIDFTDEITKEHIDFSLAPSSSFSYNPGQAKRFARSLADENQSLLMAAEIPREKILSISGTGCGMFSESEVVVLGDSYSADALASHEGFGDELGEHFDGSDIDAIEERFAKDES